MMDSNEEFSFDETGSDLEQGLDVNGSDTSAVSFSDSSSDSDNDSDLSLARQ